MSEVQCKDSGLMGINPDFIEKENLGLDGAEKQTLLKIARDSIEASVSGKKYHPSVPKNSKLLKPSGAFVTLREKGELRGCIGYIEARVPLFETVAQTASKAAMCDPRFEAVGKDELRDIEVEISVLSPLRKIISTDEIILGKHGLLIERGYYHGLLLPQVATENNWNKEQFLEYTCMKAGIGTDCYKQSGTNIYIFEAEVFGEGEPERRASEDLVERT